MNAPVLKTGVGGSPPGVRIPPHPPVASAAHWPLRVPTGQRATRASERSERARYSFVACAAGAASGSERWFRVQLSAGRRTALRAGFVNGWIPGRARDPDQVRSLLQQYSVPGLDPGSRAAGRAVRAIARPPPPKRVQPTGAACPRFGPPPPCGGGTQVASLNTLFLPRQGEGDRAVGVVEGPYVARAERPARAD